MKRDPVLIGLLLGCLLCSLATLFLALFRQPWQTTGDVLQTYWGDQREEDGQQHTVITQREPGETDADWLIRHRRQLIQAMGELK